MPHLHGCARLFLYSGLGSDTKLKAISVALVNRLPSAGRNLRDYPTCLVELELTDNMVCKLIYDEAFDNYIVFSLYLGCQIKEP